MRSKRLFCTIVILVIAAYPAFAGSIAEISLFNTGDPGGVYAISGPVFTGTAVVATGVTAPWLANDVASQWIAPTATTFSGATTVIPPDKNYTYATTFDLSAYDLTQPLSITGRWAVDDYGTIWLNGVELTATQIVFDASGAQYNSWHGFTIDSNFLQGENVLAIGVNNKGDANLNFNPTGLRVEFTGFTGTLAEAAIPEPGTLVLLGGGLFALGLFRRRR